MAVFIVLWPYLLITKLRSVIRHNLGHSNPHMAWVILIHSTLLIRPINSRRASRVQATPVACIQKTLPSTGID